MRIYFATRAGPITSSYITLPKEETLRWHPRCKGRPNRPTALPPSLHVMMNGGVEDVVLSSGMHNMMFYKLSTYICMYICNINNTGIIFF